MNMRDRLIKGALNMTNSEKTQFEISKMGLKKQNLCKSYLLSKANYILITHFFFSKY